MFKYNRAVSTDHSSVRNKSNAIAMVCAVIFFSTFSIFCSVSHNFVVAMRRSQ